MLTPPTQNLQLTEGVPGGAALLAIRDPDRSRGGVPGDLMSEGMSGLLLLTLNVGGRSLA